MQKSCAECGGAVVPKAGPGRTSHGRVGLRAIPDDVVLPTCIACGAEWMTAAELAELDARLDRAAEPYPGSSWAVLRYVPNVAAGERVNIAVVVVSRTTPPVAILHMTDATLARMKLLDPIPPFDAVTSLLGGVRDDIVRGTFDVAALERTAGEWNNAVQLSRPGPSTLTPEATIALLVPLLFPERKGPA